MVVDLERLYQRSSIECTLAQMDAADMRMRVESQSLALADLAAEWQVSQLALQDAHRLAARRTEQARHCVFLAADDVERFNEFGCGGAGCLSCVSWQQIWCGKFSGNPLWYLAEPQACLLNPTAWCP
jgi:hypothetical protein